MILLNLRLPDRRPAAEVLRQLREQPETRQIPAVVLTADVSETQRQLVLEAGARDCLTKPFSVSRLLALFDEISGEAGR